MLNEFFANCLVTRVQDIVIAEGVEKAVFKSVELEKLNGVVEEETKNENKNIFEKRIQVRILT